MDTTTVPEFKIAKVGKERKRRGAGLPFFGGGSSGGAFSGAVGGAGLLGKVGVLALIGTLSAGAWQVGKSLRPDDTGGPAAKRKLFADGGHKYTDEELAGVIRSNNGSMPNSLGYVSGSMDGMTAEERARKAAADAEAARLAEEEARKAAAEAEKEPGNVAGSPAGMDPNALVNGVAGDKNDKGAFAKKFGALSTSFGGSSLAGGSGLSGGVTRGFSNATLNNKGGGGKMASMRGGSNASIAKGARARAGTSNNKGFARRQLGNAHSLSRQAATAGPGETAAQSAGAGFENNPGAGNVISGPGVGAGNAGAGVGPSGGSVNPDTGGSAIDPNDEAAPIASPKGKNATKYQGLINAALMLLAIASIISIIMAVMKNIPFGIKETLMQVLMGIGAIVALLGVSIIAQGQQLQGGILTASGAGLAVFAYMANGGFTAGQVALNTAPQLIGAAVSSLAGVGGVLMTGKGASGSMN